MAALRTFALLFVTVPLAWAALTLVRIVSPLRGDVMASAAGRNGATLGDVQADVRWWLDHLRKGGEA